MKGHVECRVYSDGELVAYMRTTGNLWRYDWPVFAQEVRELLEEGMVLRVTRGHVLGYIPSCQPTGEPLGSKRATSCGLRP